MDFLPSVTLSAMSSEAKQDRPRVLIIANRDKDVVADALGKIEPWLNERATVVGVIGAREVGGFEHEQIPDADLALVLGGDGTMLAAARHLVDHDMPLLGVNFGKLGFLAEFSVETLLRHWEEVSARHCKTTNRVMLHVTLYDDGPDDPSTKMLYESVALNDAVITAGPPYRMIDLELSIDPTSKHSQPTGISSDGVVIATPTGSTAYNMAAGGPIVSPEVDAVCITPLSPHSLAARPLVVHGGSEIRLRVTRANEGTTLVIDGQTHTPLKEGQTVVIRRYHKSLCILHNPELTYWKMLARKMGWAARPRSG